MPVKMPSAAAQSQHYFRATIAATTLTLFLPLLASADVVFSKKDQEAVERMQKMVHNAKFKECTKIAFTMPEITYPFTMAAAATQYNIPQAQPKPGMFARLGKLMEQVSTQVPDHIPSDALYKIGRQMELQEGKKEAQITPELKAQMQRLNQWVNANCNMGDDAGKTADASKKAKPPGPAMASKPVEKAATDAPGVMFGQISDNDEAILESAKGIQLGDAPGSARIQVIFDPNAPYGAKLYQRMQAHHADVPVRWVPVAYIAKNSAAVASLLIHSRVPKQDLNTDLKYYDFKHQRGGVQPGNSHPAPLPEAQTRLMKAVGKWGGYTPMFVFRDQQGRWLETGGSGEKVISSVLARAAH